MAIGTKTIDFFDFEAKVTQSMARKKRNKERRKEREKLTRKLLTRDEPVLNHGKVWLPREKIDD